uniref:HEAT repeat domain-containing protein n=1 Tax=uncultured bacterium W4-21b TaxID=1130993 RepID=H9BWM2_9BACT|nr:hypothetical protein [uncultured bacterium W4-21b]
MNTVLKKLTKLVESDEDEIKCSAIRVLGALGIKERLVLKSLGERLASDPEPVKLAVLDAFIRTPQPQALNYLLPILKLEGNVRRRAIHAIGALGPKAITSLEKEFRSATLQEKRLFVDIFSAIHSKSAVDFLVASLLEGDLELLKYICFALRNQIEKMSKSEKLYLMRKVNQFLNLSSVKKNDEMTTSGILLLGYIGEPQAKATMLKFLDKKHSFYVRRNALYALTRLQLKGAGNDTVVEKVFPLLNDSDYPNVVRNVLSILDVISLPKRFYKQLPKLLQVTSHSTVKRFALKRLAESKSKETIKLLISHLDSNDPMVRDAAVEALGEFRGAIPELLKKVDTATELDRAEKITLILRKHRDYFKKEKCRVLYRKFEKLIKTDAMRAKVYALLLKHVNPDFFYAEVLKKAKQLKRKKKWALAKEHLDQLATGLFYTDEVRYEMASVLLNLSKKDMGVQGRTNDPAVQLFSVLARVNFSNVIAMIKKDRTLDANSLYYLGFHFAEKMFEQKAFGIEVLKYLLKRFPRSKVASATRKKIKLAGVVTTTKPGSLFSPSEIQPRATARK